MLERAALFPVPLFLIPTHFISLIHNLQLHLLTRVLNIRNQFFLISVLHSIFHLCFET